MRCRGLHRVLLLHIIESYDFLSICKYRLLSLRDPVFARAARSAQQDDTGERILPLSSSPSTPGAQPVPHQS